MEKKKIRISALATGTFVLGAFAGNQATAGDVQSFEDLGSGAEFRSELLANNNAIEFIDNREIELKCGEGTCGETPKTGEKTDEEVIEGGENTVEPVEGEKATQEVRDSARTRALEQGTEGDDKSKKGDDKASEHKCGEGTCG